jgi:hypothetical protein
MGPGSEYDVEARSCPECRAAAQDAIQQGTLDHMYGSDFIRREHEKHSGKEYSEDDEFDNTDLRYMQNEHEGDGVMVGGTAICETCGAKLNRVTDKCKDPNHNRPISTSQQSGY